MITGAQLREARRLLRLGRADLSRRSKVPFSALVRAEGADGQPAGITVVQANTLQRVLEAAGVEFTNGEGPGARLRNNT